jgi:hypothetical protein
MANQEQNDEIEIQHRVLIEEEEIEISKLPAEIRNAMRKFNAKLTEYEESGDSALFLEIQQDDVALANNILTFIEDEESEEEEEVEVDEEEEEEEEDKTQTQTQAKAQPKVKEVEPIVQPVVATASSDEEKVKASMKDGVISVEQLESILNREPDYPYEQVGSLKLKKQYLRPFYEVAS